MLKVTISPEFQTNSKTLEEYISEELDIVMDKLAAFLEKQARSNHRYKSKTGTLKKDTMFKALKGRITGYVSDSNKYGKYVQAGHGTWSPDPFIDNAVESNKVYIDNEIDQAIDKAADKYLRSI